MFLEELRLQQGQVVALYIKVHAASLTYIYVYTHIVFQLQHTIASVLFHHGAWASALAEVHRS